MRQHTRLFLILLGGILCAASSMRAQAPAATAAYALSEGTGIATADGSGGSSDGTVENGTAWTSAGRFGNALVFDGTDDHVLIADTAALDLTNAFTLGAWVYPTTSTPYGMIVAKEGDGQHAYALGITNGGRVTIVMSTGSGSQTLLGDGIVQANRWSYIAATYDGSRVRLYVDGVQDTYYDITGTIVTSSNPLRIGKDAWGSPFTGRIDEIRVYAASLNAAEIANDMYLPVDPSTPLTVAAQTPAPNQLGVITTPVTAIFTEPMNAATLTTSMFTLEGPGGPVAGSVSYSAATRQAIFTPSAALADLTDYTATVIGGGSGVGAADGSALATNVTWTFRTAANSLDPGAAYGFSEGTGGTTSDTSGNGAHGTLTNSPTWTTNGVYGGALTFAGGSDHVAVADSDALDATTAFTLEGWIYPTSTPAYGKLLDKEGIGQHVYSLGVSNGGRLTVHMATASGTHNLLGDASVPSNQWTHVAAVYDGSTVRLYLNGVQDTYYDVMGTINTSVKPLWIGKGPSGEGFTGRLDELRVYRRALTPTEIVNDMYLPVDQSTPLAVATHTPAANAIAVITTPVTATFTEPMNAATLTTSTFSLEGPGGTVAGSVSYDTATRTATLTPSAALSASTNYTATVVGGVSGVEASDGSTLVSNVSWTFRTAAGVLVPSGAYGFSEGTGVTTADASGNENHGTLTNGSAWSTDGVFGNALLFDGNDDHVAVQDSDALDLTDAFTLEAWVHPTATPAYGKIVDKEGIGQHVYALGISNGGLVTVQVAAASGAQSLLGNTAVATNQWTHVAATYNGATVRIYVNGVQDTYYDVTGALVSSVKPLWIGKGPSGEGFTGRLDELRIYRRALTAAEITADMGTPIAGDIEPPTVLAASPSDGADGVSTSTAVQATFSEPLAPATITSTSFELRDAGGNLMPATVSYTVASATGPDPIRWTV